MKERKVWKIEDENIDKPPKNKGSLQKGEVKKFSEEYGKFFQSYIGDAPFEVRDNSEVPEVEALGTFAIDLGKVATEGRGIIYSEPKFFEEKYGYSKDKALFAFLHEFEHLREVMELLNDKNGEKAWAKHIAKIDKKKRFQIFDNCFDDIKMNRGVVSRAPTLDDSRANLYKENAFPKTDYTKDPKHLQFSYAFLHEAMLDDKIDLSADVRSEVDRLKNIKVRGRSLVDFATDPNTPMSARLEIQKRFFEPILEKFYQEDKEKKKKEGKKDGEGKGDKEQGGEENKNNISKKDEKGQLKKPKSSKESDEELFKKEYEEYDKNNPQSISKKKIAEAVKNYIEAKKKQKTADELALEAYTKAEGVKTEELLEYRKFWQEVENLKNPETDEYLVEELREIFKRIITERMKPKISSKYPEKEGDLLMFPTKAVVDIKSGVKEPEVWETIEQKERPADLFGDFDVTLICDRSGSMNGAGKDIAQRQATTLLLEVLKEFSDDLEENKIDLEYNLNVRTEAWSFGDSAQCEMLKGLSSSLSEKERVYVYNKLSDVSGTTRDFETLEKVKNFLSEDDLEKIRNKKLKKIIFVLSDGGSDNPSKTQNLLKDLREKGILVYGIGMTSSAEAIRDTYAPDALVCDKIENLPLVVGNLLKKEIDNLNERLG